MGTKASESVTLLGSLAKDTGVRPLADADVLFRMPAGGQPEELVSLRTQHHRLKASRKALRSSIAAFLVTQDLLDDALKKRGIGDLVPADELEEMLVDSDLKSQLTMLLMQADRELKKLLEDGDGAHAEA